MFSFRSCFLLCFFDFFLNTLFTDNYCFGMLLNFLDAGVAQLVEQLICNQSVVGSNPIAGSIICV